MAKKKSTSNEPNLDHIAEGLRPLAIEINTLTPDPDNTVTHDAKSVQAIQRSLDRFGQDQPLVVQKEGLIVRKGNGRLQAARELGWTHIAAVVVAEDNLAAVARSIADNRSGEFKTWDYSKLIELMSELKEGGADTEAVGFNNDQLDELIQKFGDEPDLIPSGAPAVPSGDSPAAGSPSEDGSTADELLSNTSQVRMVHLFFNVETFAEFTLLTENLQEKFETTNQTDTVLEAIRRSAISED